MKTLDWLRVLEINAKGEATENTQIILRTKKFNTSFSGMNESNT